MYKKSGPYGCIDPLKQDAARAYSVFDMNGRRFCHETCLRARNIPDCSSLYSNEFLAPFAPEQCAFHLIDLLPDVDADKALAPRIEMRPHSQTQF